MARKQYRPLVACPECKGHRVGRIGTRQYFCSDCCLEFVLRNGRVDLYEVDEEGNLVTAGRLDLSDAPVAISSTQSPAARSAQD